MPELGPDGDLVTATITTVVLPRLAKLLEEGALDPFSGKDIRRLVDLVEEVETSVERSNHKFQVI
jgi:GC-rich sequence DNA-binding factor